MSSYAVKTEIPANLAEHCHSCTGISRWDVSRLVVQGEYSRRESSGEYRYTSAWMKMQGRWRMLANQITLIAATHTVNGTI